MKQSKYVKIWACQRVIKNQFARTLHRQYVHSKHQSYRLKIGQGTSLMEVSGQFHTQNMNFHENENYKPDEAVEYAYNEGQPSVQARDKEQKFLCMRSKVLTVSYWN